MAEHGTEEEIFEDDISFLSVDQVIAIHGEMIRRYSPGESLHIRDRGLLESAVLTPKQTMFGAYLYASIPEMAAAYLVGLAQNHAFENGNKRVAFASCSMFLRINGFMLTLTEDEAVQLTLDVVNHRIGREALTDYIDEALEPIV